MVGTHAFFRRVTPDHSCGRAWGQLPQDAGCRTPGTPSEGLPPLWRADPSPPPLAHHARWAAWSPALLTSLLCSKAEVFSCSLGQRRCFHREKTCSGHLCDTQTTGLSHPKAPHPAPCPLSPDALHSEPICVTWGRSICWKEPHRKYFKLCRPHPHSLCCTVFRFGCFFFNNSS